MTTIYDLYMDESGKFEGEESKKKRKTTFLLGMLVPDDIKETLSNQFRKVAKSYGFSGFLHATDIHTKKKFPEFASALIEIIVNSNTIPFVTSYDHDIFFDLPESLQESNTVNRYVNMSQTLIEHILFLHTDFLGKDLVINFHPNSRVVIIPKNNRQAIDDFKAMGFGSRSIIHKTDSKTLFFVWTNDSLRAYLHRIAIEYTPWRKISGARSWKQVETVVAKNSDDPFVHWVDMLAWIYREGSFHDSELRTAHLQLRKHIALKIVYGQEQQEYRYLVRLYLDRNFVAFFRTALDRFSDFSEPYYKQNLNKLLNEGLENLELPSLTEIKQLETVIHTYLRDSRGNWNFVLRLIELLLGAVKKLPAEVKMEQQEVVNRLLFQLYNHKISVHNHRGEDAASWGIYEKMVAIDQGKMDISMFREWLEMENRMAVTAANIFAFELGTANLELLLKGLEKSFRSLQKLSKFTLSDPLIGKIKGSLGQNYAFLSSKNKELFPKAEKLFLDARSQFSRADDRLRHDINLLHLYLDWANDAKASNCFDVIINSPSYSRFKNKPANETARFMQFSLSAELKFHLYKENNFEELLDFFPLNKLLEWFGDAANEHPFEFICGYLGRMAMQANRKKEALNYFQHAVSIPHETDHNQQPTLQLIRCQLITLMALEDVHDNKTRAKEKMAMVVSVLKDIGETEELSTILKLGLDHASGWFAPAWDALNAVDWQKEFNPTACRIFLDCFTFNYH